MADEPCDWDLSARVNHSKLYSFSSISDVESSPEPIRREKVAKASTPLSEAEIRDENDSSDQLSSEASSMDTVVHAEQLLSRESQELSRGSSKQGTAKMSIREENPRDKESKDIKSSDTAGSITLTLRPTAALSQEPKAFEDPNVSPELTRAALTEHGFVFERSDSRSSERSSSDVDPYDYLDRKLCDVEATVIDLEECALMANDDSVDLQSAKKSLDDIKSLTYTRDKLELEAYEVLKLGRGMVNDKFFDAPVAEDFSLRMDNIANRLRILRDDLDKEMARLFNLYIILLRQNLERMHDWLVRAEAKMTLEDDIGQTYDEVVIELGKHLNFQKELGIYSTVNVIFEIDMEDAFIDESLREDVKMVSERWAAVWNWTEDRKQRISEVIFDWEKFREEETMLLEWLGGKEETLKLVGHTDISDEQEVDLHKTVLENILREMNTQGKRLDGLREASDTLLLDARYRNSTAKGIKNAIRDFGDCWQTTLENAQRRKQQILNSRRKFLQMAGLVKEMKTWLSEAEDLLRTAEPFKNNNEDSKVFRAKIETKCHERDKQQEDMEKINRLKNELDEEIDQSSNSAITQVTDPLNKRWQEASDNLDRCRDSGGLPYDSRDCCLIRYFKLGLLMVT